MTRWNIHRITQSGSQSCSARGVAFLGSFAPAAAPGASGAAAGPSSVGSVNGVSDSRFFLLLAVAIFVATSSANSLPLLVRVPMRRPSAGRSGRLSLLLRLNKWLLLRRPAAVPTELSEETRADRYMLAEEAEAEGFGAVASKRAPPALRCGGAWQATGPRCAAADDQNRICEVIAIGVI